MRALINFIIVLITISLGACSDHKSSDVLPCLDVRQNYSEKEIILTDIADVTYLHLSTENDDYLYQGIIDCITDNYFIVCDRASGSVLFFSKDGKPKSRFNRKGQGAEEYINVMAIVYDEDTDDVFITTTGNNEIILVYSSSGEYKRKLVIKGTFINGFLSYDDESLLIYNSNADIKRNAIDESELPEDYCDVQFIRISKADGEVLDYIELNCKKISLQDKRALKGEGRGGPAGRTNRFIKNKEGLLLCNPENDTVFFYGKNKTLTPLICKTPLLDDLDPMVYMNNCVDAGMYQFTEVYIVRYEEGYFPFPVKYYMRDKQTGEIFRPKITLPDYKGKEFFISPLRSRNYENGIYYELELKELKEALNENKLGGKLKELISTLNESEDNNVFIMVNFK